MIWQTLSVNKVVERLATDKTNGLSADEAKLRLASSGKNEISRQKKTVFLKNSQNNLTII